MPIYYAYSPTELPPPADWPDRMHVTGYWFLDPPPGWQPPADLLHFLQAGPAPVSIGFGSMASRDAEATLNLVLKALELSGQRGVLLSGWAGIGKGRTVPSHVFSAESLPHSWLFPRMAAVVHHGANEYETLACSCLSNDQVLPGCLDHFFRHHPGLVDLQNSLDLHQQAVNETNISSCDADNSSSPSAF